MTDTIYNKIGPGYNTTRRADPYICSRLYTLLEPIPDGHYLDIGCGTGNYTVKLEEMGLHVTGIDPSDIMLNEAKGKSRHVQWLKGYAEHIPLPGNSIDGIIATLTIHHWNDPQKAFTEIARVLKPGGRMVIFTFTPEQEAGYWFNHFFPQMMKKGIQKSMSLQTLTTITKAAGLNVAETEKYDVRDDLQDMFGYSGKNDPERYFDPQVIKGISYFSIYADEQEVISGLAKLRECIDKGSFEAIKQQYDKCEGDYLFVVLQKPG